MSPAPLEGQTIGKYRILEALGRGGMAQVYRAYHPQLDRYVAIKLLRPDLAEDKEFLARFRREARAVASLRHANIVQVFDFDNLDNQYYMVMELLQGDSLRARLNQYRSQSQRMPLPEAINIIQDVLRGLGYAHSQGIIHRDIKPANIMLNSHGQGVITDFGIAQIMGGKQTTVSGALMGTLSYMAPEQGLKGLCDQRSDLYSLEIMFYEMLTGFTPFDADTPLAILMKHLNDPLPLPRQVDPILPLALEQIILKGLAKDPDERYQSCEEMSADLEQLNLIEYPAGPRKIAGPQNVFSGTARQQISDLRFSQQDTDPDLSQSLQQNSTIQSGAQTPRMLKGLLTNPLNIPGAILGSLGSILFLNFCAVALSRLSPINIFQRGWPFELFLLAGFLSVLMWAIETSWLLIPIGIIFGNAILLAYSTMTGRWTDWVFLWMLEPLIIGLAIYAPFQLKQTNIEQKLAARIAGILFSLFSVCLASLACILTLVTSRLR